MKPGVHPKNVSTLQEVENNSYSSLRASSPGALAVVVHYTSAVSNHVLGVLPYMAYSGLCHKTRQFFFTSLSFKGYKILCESVLIINSMKFVCTQTITWICSIAIANKWLKNRTACTLSFVLNGVIKFRLLSQTVYVFRICFVLNRVRVSNPQRLTDIQILVEYPPESLLVPRFICPLSVNSG